MSAEVLLPAKATVAITPPIPMAWVAALVALLALLLLAALHVGFQASDDADYLTGALGWIEHFPYVGDSHWTLRHTITLPTALLVQLLGMNEFSVSLSNMLYFLALLALNAVFCLRYLGKGGALVTSLLLITMPGFLVVATYLNPDIPEVFFVSAAFWFWRSALDDPARTGRWLACGFFLGFAFVNRETSAALVLFIGLIFLFRPLAPRSRYVLIAAAFVLVAVADWLYLTLSTGNSMYRLGVDFHHDVVDRAAYIAELVTRGGLIDKQGNISVNVFVDPLLNLFISQKYTLLFWLLIPAGLHAYARRREPAMLTIGLLAGFGLVWFVFVSANPKLYLVPRYFVVVAWVAAVIVGWWLSECWASRRHLLVAALLACGLLANALALSVENIDPRFIERQLVTWVAAHPGETIYTDIETYIRASYYFRFADVSMDRVSTDRPPAGRHFFYSAERVAECATTPRCRKRVSDYRPSPSWRVEQTIEKPKRALGKLVQGIGIDSVLPTDIRRRVVGSGVAVTIYSVR